MKRLTGSTIRFRHIYFFDGLRVYRWHNPTKEVYMDPGVHAI